MITKLRNDALYLRENWPGSRGADRALLVAFAVIEALLALCGALCALAIGAWLFSLLVAAR